jgi:hypothetical protein
MQDGWKAVLAATLALAGVAHSLRAQQMDAFSTYGQVLLNGRETPYQVRHLPVSSFPVLPAAIAAQLNQRDCLIPQTYQAHAPENVIHASLRQAGETDWAVLCSVRGSVSLLVFFGDAYQSPEVVRTAMETDRLELNTVTGKLEFAWGIDRASPERIRDAQAGMRRRPARLDHDAIADVVIDRETVYRFYTGSGWTLLDTQDY